jgi:O-antigen/teichoic acid export membrane protein
MGILKRQSLKSSVVNYIGAFLGVVFFNFIFPHLISAEYLGLIGLIQYLTLILACLPTLGLTHILIRFFSTWKENHKHLASFNGFSIITILIATFVLLISLLVFKSPIVHFYQTRSSLFLPYYYIIFPILICQVFLQYLEGFSMIKHRITAPTFVREILLRVLLIVVVYLFAYEFISEANFVNSIGITYLVAFLVLAFYAIKILRLSVRSPKLYLKQNPLLKSELAYGASMFLIVIFLVVQNMIDGIMIPSYLGLAELAIYLRPLVVAQMILIPYRAIAGISIPLMRESFANQDIVKVRELNKSISINLFIIGTFLFTIIMVNGVNFFKLLPLEYSKGIYVLYIVAFARLIDMSFGLNTEIIYTSNHYKPMIWFAGIACLLNIVLNAMLIPRFGAIGSAISLAAVVVIFNLMKSIFIYKSLQMHSFSFNQLKLLTIALITIATLYFIPYISFINNHMFANALANIAFKTFIACLLFIFPLYHLQISRDFNEFFKLVISGKIFKGGHRMDNL